AKGRQAFQVDGIFRFWGNAPVEVVGGGVGLVNSLFAAAEAMGVEVWYETRATRLITGADGRVEGVQVNRGGRLMTLSSRAVVLACGGFEANPEMRARYLGPGWDLALVRG